MHEPAKGRAARPAFTEAEREVVRRFLRGEITFAQLEGITADEASRIARSGHALFRKGRLDEARTLFEGLAAMNPLDPYPHQVLGAIAERTAKVPLAIKHYDVCLSLGGENPFALARRGELRIVRGLVKAGVADLADACRLDGDGALPSTRRARLILATLVKAAEAARRAPRAPGPTSDLTERPTKLRGAGDRCA